MTDRIVAVEANIDRAIPLSTVNEVATENARKMFYALTMLLQGPPFLLFKKVERGDGFEPWRLLVDRYDGANASRLHHMLQSIMRPKAFPQDAGGCEVFLNEWEHLVQHLDILASDFSERRSQASDPSRHGSRWYQSSVDSRRPPEQRNVALCDHFLPCRLERLGRDSWNTELHGSTSCASGGGRTDTTTSQV